MTTERLGEQPFTLSINMLDVYPGPLTDDASALTRLRSMTRRQTEHRTVLSRSGLTASLSEDRFVRGGWVLSVDGVPQSQIMPERPSALVFEYIQRIGTVIDLFRPGTDSVSTLHLGAGALTLPRYLSATRPGSRSQVIEWEEDLVDFVRDHLPWDPSWSIRVRYGDARQMLTQLPQGLQGAVDLVVVDVFSGNATPSHLTTVEFFQLLPPLLAPGGVVAVNLVDVRGGRFARAEAAALQEVFGFVGILGESGVIKGRRTGNYIMVATREKGVPPWWEEVVRRGPHPTTSMTGTKVDRFVSGIAPQRDDASLPSPELTRSFIDVD